MSNTIPLPLANASHPAYRLPLNVPITPNLEKVNKYIESIHKKQWFTNFGYLERLLEEKLSDYLNIENFLLVSNGTIGLQVAAKVLKVNKVITSPYSFAATSAAMDWIGVDLDYVDVDNQTLNISPYLLADKLKNTQSDTILPVHIYGNACDVDRLDQLAMTYGKKLIYDAAQCFGVKWKDNSILNYGDASIISFHATKVFHTLEGGGIRFRNKSDYLHAKECINFGFSNGTLNSFGTNAKMNEYQAAAGLVLLDDIEDVLDLRKTLFQRYIQNLKDCVDLPRRPVEANYNGSYFPVIFSSQTQCRDTAVQLEQNGVQTRVYFKEPLNQVYTTGIRCSNTEHIVERVLTLPLHAQMTLSDVDYVCDLVKLNV